MFLVHSIIFIGILIFLYAIHDYLYLPDKTFDAMKIHLFDNNMGNSDYKLVYDKIHFLSWNSLKFALIWGVIMFVILCASVQYIKLIKDSRRSKRISLITIFLSLFISTILYCYTIISNFSYKELEVFQRYFSYPFTHDLTTDGQKYDKIINVFNNHIFLWSWSAFIVSIFFLLSIFIFYFVLSKVFKMYQEYNQLLDENISEKEYRSIPNTDISSEFQSDTSQEKNDSINRINTKENKVQLDENIDPISSETTLKPTTESIHKIEPKQGLKKLKMVNKIGENHTSI